MSVVEYTRHKLSTDFVEPEKKSDIYVMNLLDRNQNTRNVHKQLLYWTLFKNIDFEPISLF